jgi:DNA polymerase I-like protein with 3'-5' exonuclease and polymerase domains
MRMVASTAISAAVTLIRIDARLRADLPDTAQILLQIHDEFVVEVDDEERAVAAKAAVEREMVAAFSALLPDAPSAGLVEAHAGADWAMAKG